MNRLFVGWFGSRSCGVARSIIAGFHPVDPGSNPGTSTMLFFVLQRGHCVLKNEKIRIVLEPLTSTIKLTSSIVEAHGRAPLQESYPVDCILVKNVE